MKHLRLILGTALVLFFLGLAAGPYALKITEVFLDKKTISMSIGDPFFPGLTLGLLLALCAITAGVILWAYGRSRLPGHPVLVFGFSLLILIIAAAAETWLKLLQGKFIFYDLLVDESMNNSIPTRVINYFSFSSETVLLAGGMATVALLWVARRQESHIPATDEQDHRRRLLLILATVGISLWFFIFLAGFICNNASLIGRLFS